ncbi:MAG: hypothetical protein AMK73_05910 [Planctomycetes bacterium SM23_32]|nr:MAG: hypothetical protein AMK73_05910 [Planctomycetes bacterium SM23_32]
MEVRAELRTFAPTLVLPGEVECPRTDDVMSHYRWWVNIQWLKPEGHWVAAGETAAVVFQDGLSNWVETDRLQLAMRRATAVARAARAELAEVDRRHSVAVAERAWERARRALKELERGATPEELRLAEIEVERARCRLAAADRAMERLQAVGRNSDVPEEQAEELTHRRELAAAALDMAQTALSALKARPTELELLAARAAVRAAQAALESRRHEAAASGQQERAEVTHAREVAEDFGTEVAARESMLTTMERKANLAGVVRWEEKPGAAGVSPRIILTVVDPAVVVFLARATQRQVSRLSVGRPCRVSLAAVPEGSLPGTIASISLTSEDLAMSQVFGREEEWKETDCRVYEVMVEMERDEGTALYQGMTGHALVALSEPAEWIVIPSSCVVSRGAADWALVRDGHDWRARQVVLAGRDDRFVAVASGLSAGEAVAVLAD